MAFFNDEWYKGGLDFQKEMASRYMDTINSFGFFPREKSWHDDWQESMKKWTDFYSETFESLKSDKGFFGFNPAKDIADMSEIAKVFDRFADSMSIYTKLQSLWIEYIGKVTDDPEDYLDASKEYMEATGKLVGETAKDMIRPFISEDIFSMMESYENLNNTAKDAYNEFLAPWTAKKDELAECYNKAMAGDWQSCGKYMSLITEIYQDTFGKMFRSTGIGIFKDKAELNFKTFDSYVNLMLSYFEMLANVQNILNDANKELWEQIVKIMEESDKNMTFKDFYDMWIKINSKAINDFYFTDEFASFMGKFADNASDFKIKYDEFMESLLESLPIPTNSEMKSVYKTVYDLRKEVRSLKKEIKGFRKELDDLNKTEE